MTANTSPTRTQTPDASTFASALGQAAWLMTVSKEHRDLPVRFIEERITPSIILQQFKIYMKEKQPIAFLAWAAVSEEVATLINSPQYTPKLEDWRSGNKIVVLECISPFAPRAEIINQFLANSAAVGGAGE